MDQSIETRESLWREFLKQWPAERLPTMTLTEYSKAGDQSCFTYWLESKTEALGSVWGGSAFKFGIYARDDKSQKEDGTSRCYNDDYAWYKKFGATQDEAFEQVRSAILGIVDAVTNGDLKAIENSQLGPAITWKIAFLYQPQQSRIVLPIYALKELQGALQSQNTLSAAEIYPLLLAKKPLDQAFFEFADTCWSNSKAWQDQTSTSQPSLNPEANSPSTLPMPLNQILFGPPGTGKTYATIEAALTILDAAYLEQNSSNRLAQKFRFDQLAQEGRIGFVTFHQSFSYEDFVEGLRAEKDEETGQVHYPIVDGVFKSLCLAASVKVVQQAEAPIDLKGRRIWKMSLGNTQGDDAGIFDECLAGGYVLLGYGGKIDFQGCKSRADVISLFETEGETLSNPSVDYGVTSVLAFVSRMTKGDLIVVSDGNSKFRAIGEIEGDYEYKPHLDYDDGYAQCRKVKWLRSYKPSLPHTELMNNRFSQMTLYELRSGSINMDKLSGLLGTVASTNHTGFKVGQIFGKDYSVTYASTDVVELKKPNGKTLGFPMRLLRELEDYVRKGRITIQDIRDKEVFNKVPETQLEPYIVNGYYNVLSPLVEHLIQAQGEADKPASDSRVLIIDEINRGNVSRVFGELITLIEPSKRAGAAEALEVVLPYSKEKFSVPSNVYLIGTMNTADRSLSGLDIALRRRFHFREMPPRPELLAGLMVSGIDIEKLLRVMNERIEVLLDRDHRLGHAYFMPLHTNPQLECLAEIFRNQVLPLLQEYFFEDWQRICWVLNDHRKPKADQFVQQQSHDMPSLFGEGVSISDHVKSWLINSSAFNRPSAYLGVIAAPSVIQPATGDA